MESFYVILGGGLVFLLVYCLTRQMFARQMFDNSLDEHIYESANTSKPIQKSNKKYHAKFRTNSLIDFLTNSRIKSQKHKHKKYKKFFKSPSKISKILITFLSKNHLRFFLAFFAGCLFMVFGKLDFYPYIFSYKEIFDSYLFYLQDFVPYRYEIFGSGFGEWQSGFGNDLIRILAFVYVCALFGFMFVLCAFDCKYLAVLDWHNVAFLALCLCKVFFMSHSFYGLFYDFIQVLLHALCAAGLLSLALLLGKVLLRGKEILGEGDIIFCAGFGGLFGFTFLIGSIFWGCVLASVAFICAKISLGLIAKNYPKHTKSKKSAKSKSDFLSTLGLHKFLDSKKSLEFFSRIPLIPFVVLGGIAKGIYLAV
ncbi:prepilin peptidase [Helicobacter sp. MIT 01-3238]|uniref:prepilin peptidase n=1 Tax=Helicobacter sp. MIT 01-3238 TaxID=398627 RepID=UPI000E1EA063|nr:prepilin peptidase [Helicobacter sp. MIT 01-3238]RDU52318.1 hypothetical protein CQA40_07585 [Helicobacter sp. MIT 01-3238]